MAPQAVPTPWIFTPKRYDEHPRPKSWESTPTLLPPDQESSPYRLSLSNSIFAVALFLHVLWLLNVKHGYGRDQRRK